MSGTGRRHRVILADDDLPLRMLLRILLERDGRFEVVAEADDGKHAIALTEHHDPDLLVLDLSMPEMDGLEVLEQLGRRDGRDRPVIAVLTGFPEPDLEDQARAAGAAAYLTKGSAFGRLTDDLAELLAPSETPAEDV